MHRYHPRERQLQLIVLGCWAVSAAITGAHVRSLTHCPASKKRVYYIVLSGIPLVVASGCVLSAFCPELAPLWEWAVRFCEAQALYLFGKLILVFAGGHEEFLRSLADKPANKYFAAPPVCCLAPCVPETTFTETSLSLCKAIIVQFRLVVLALFFIYSVDFLAHGGLHNGKVPAKQTFILANVCGISVALCIYGLIVIYHAGYEELGGARLIEKFLSMKLIIVLSAFQSEIADGLRAGGFIMADQEDTLRTDCILAIFKSVLLATECPGMALMSAWAFSAKELHGYPLIDSRDSLRSMLISHRRRMSPEDGP